MQNPKRGAHVDPGEMRSVRIPLPVLQLPLFLACLAVAAPLAAAAGDAGLTLEKVAASIGSAEARQAIRSISARADANGPRGAFTSEIVSLDEGEVRFELRRGEALTELLLRGGSAFARETAGAPLVPAEASLASFIRGHEVHRILLALDRRFRADFRGIGGSDAGCLALRDTADVPARICLDSATGLPTILELAVPEAMGGGKVTLELADWRALHGVRLPHAVDFVRGNERHTYRYTEVLPFRLAPGAYLPEGPEARFARLGDLAALASAHHRVMEGHRRSDAALFVQDGSERSMMSGRGVLSETTREAVAARLGPYLASIRFTRYEDVAVPMIAVSADGTLGWLACQIEAAGEQAQPVQENAGAAPTPPPTVPIAYGFSWVELYARLDGSWASIGNASSARP